MAALALARAGDTLALPLLPQVAGIWSATAAAIRAQLFWVQGDADRALAAFSAAIAGFRTDPWNSVIVMRETLPLARDRRPSHLAGRSELLDQPLSVGCWIGQLSRHERRDDYRLPSRAGLAARPVP
jgi:hypothetical protein